MYYKLSILAQKGVFKFWYVSWIKFTNNDTRSV